MQYMLSNEGMGEFDELIVVLEGHSPAFCLFRLLERGLIIKQNIEQPELRYVMLTETGEDFLTWTEFEEKSALTRRLTFEKLQHDEINARRVRWFYIPLSFFGIIGGVLGITSFILQNIEPKQKKQIHKELLQSEIPKTSHKFCDSAN